MRGPQGHPPPSLPTHRQPLCSQTLSKQPPLSFPCPTSAQELFWGHLPHLGCSHPAPRGCRGGRTEGSPPRKTTGRQRIYGSIPLRASGFLPAPSFPPPKPSAPINRNSLQPKAGKHKQGTAGLREADTDGSVQGRGAAGTGRSPRGGPQEGRGQAKAVPPNHLAPRRGQEGTERGGDLGLGGITTAGQGSRDRNCRSGLRLGIHLDFKGNKRESCERRGTKLFLKGQNHNHFYLRFQILHSCHSV